MNDRNRFVGYQPYDPNIMAAMEAWAQGGASPFLDNYDLNAYAPYTPYPEDMDEYGTMDYAKDSLNLRQDVTDQFADPLAILQLGTSAGGYGPQAFQPTTQYMPVQASGYMMAEQMSQSQDPLQRYIGQALLQNKNPLTIEAEINALVTNPQDDQESDLGAALAASLPPLYNDYGERVEGGYDWNGLRQQIGYASSALAKDTPGWDRQTFDPNTNLPAIAVQQPGVGTQALERAGIEYSPYDTYDPNMFATPEALQVEQQAMSDFDRSQQQYQEQLKNMEAMKRLVANQLRDPAEFLAPPAGMAQAPASAVPGQQPARQGMTPQRGGWSDDLERLTQDPMAQIRSMEMFSGGSPDPAAWLDRNIGDPIESFFGGGDSGEPSTPQAPKSYVNERTGLVGGVPRPNLGRGMLAQAAGGTTRSQRAGIDRDRLADLRRQSFQTGLSARNAGQSANEAAMARAIARYHQGQRQDYVQRLADQGHTPFNHTLRSRMAGLYGF